jgi:ferritin-like metal-binding protein YciE
MSGSNGIQELYLQGVRDAHALEAQAIQIMSRQVERLENYPDMKAGLERHIRESKDQQARLEQIMSAHGTSASVLKEAVTSLAGNAAAIGHAFTSDEVIKNSFANYAFEHLEQAAYMSLIAMAEAAGDQQHIPLLKQNLEQEIAFGKACGDLVVPTTQRYMQLQAAGQKAKV